MADEEEAACPLPKIREDCEPKCASCFAAYLACKQRIEAKGAGDCEPYYFDWLKCIDKCASHGVRAFHPHKSDYNVPLTGHAPNHAQAQIVRVRFETVAGSVFWHSRPHS